MAAPTWRGAIELAGFPVHVALYNRVKSDRNGGGFRMLGTDDKPVKQALVESGEYAKLEKDPLTKVATIGRNDTRKGVEIGKDQYKALPQTAIDKISEAERTTQVTPKCFVPVDTLPVELADKAMVVVPDDKVAGSEQSVNLLWNGLLDTGYAYCTEVTLRSGSRDAILCLYAHPEGLYAVTLPFEHDLSPVPTFEYTDDDKARALFSKVVEGEYQVRDSFVLSEFVSTYRERREKAIDAALAGKKVEAPKAPSFTGRNLMDALEESVKAAPGAKSRGKGKSKARAQAKKRTSRKKVAA